LTYHTFHLTGIGLNLCIGGADSGKGCLKIVNGASKIPNPNSSALKLNGMEAWPHPLLRSAAQQRIGHVACGNEYQILSGLRPWARAITLAA